jgi:hypothetical protein
MKYRQVHMRQIASVRCIHQTNGGAAEVEIREKYYSGLQINSPPNTFYVPANISICLFSQKKTYLYACTFHNWIYFNIEIPFNLTLTTEILGTWSSLL